MVHEERVADACHTFQRVEKLCNVVTMLTVSVFLIIVLVLPMKVPDTEQSVILLLSYGIIAILIVTTAGHMKQRYAFLISIALLKYIEENNEDVKVPEFPDGLNFPGKRTT